MCETVSVRAGPHDSGHFTEVLRKHTHCTSGFSALKRRTEVFIRNHHAVDGVASWHNEEMTRTRSGRVTEEHKSTLRLRLGTKNVVYLAINTTQQTYLARFPRTGPKSSFAVLHLWNHPPGLNERGQHRVFHSESPLATRANVSATAPPLLVTLPWRTVGVVQGARAM